MKKNSQNWFYFYAEDTQTGAAKTGLTITVNIIIDGGTPIASTNSVSSIGNGYYKLLCTASECNGNNLLLLPSTVTTLTRIIPIGYETQNVVKEVFSESSSDYMVLGTMGRLLNEIKADTDNLKSDTDIIRSDLDIIKTDTGVIKVGVNEVLSDTSIIIAKVDTIISALSNIPEIGSIVSDSLDLLKAIAYGRYDISGTTTKIIQFYREDEVTPFFATEVTATSRSKHV
jgi:uncharacterized protein YoxC